MPKKGKNGKKIKKVKKVKAEKIPVVEQKIDSVLQVTSNQHKSKSKSKSKLNSNKMQTPNASFQVNVFGNFKNDLEVLNWLQMANTFDDEYYKNIKFEMVSKTKQYIVKVYVEPSPGDNKQNINFEIMYFVENIDDDGNYPVNGQLVSLELVPNSISITGF